MNGFLVFFGIIGIIVALFAIVVIAIYAGSFVLVAIKAFKTNVKAMTEVQKEHIVACAESRKARLQKKRELTLAHKDEKASKSLEMKKKKILLEDKKQEVKNKKSQAKLDKAESRISRKEKVEELVAEEVKVEKIVEPVIQVAPKEVIKEVIKEVPVEDKASKARIAELEKALAAKTEECNKLAEANKPKEYPDAAEDTSEHVD